LEFAPKARPEVREGVRAQFARHAVTETAATTAATAVATAMAMKSPFAARFGRTGRRSAATTFVASPSATNRRDLDYMTPNLSALCSAHARKFGEKLSRPHFAAIPNRLLSNTPNPFSAIGNAGRLKPGPLPGSGANGPARRDILSAVKAGPAIADQGDADMSLAPGFPPLANFFVKSRTAGEMVIGLPIAEQKRFRGVYKVVFPRGPNAPIIEIGHSLEIKPERIENEKWKGGREAKFLVAESAKIIPYEPRQSPKIDDLDSATCKNLSAKLGADYVAEIAADPTKLAAFRYSPAKREIVVAACKAEAKAGRAVKGRARRIFDALRYADVSPARARELLPQLVDPLAGSGPRVIPSVCRGAGEAIETDPYRPLFAGALTFKKADRFARAVAPATAAGQRPQAIIIAALRKLAEDGHTLASLDEIADRAWLDFGLKETDVSAAIQILVERRGVIRRVGHGAIGLSSLIDAERKIEAAICANDKSSLSQKAVAVIEDVIARAGELLGRPDFVLDEDQADALRRIFENRVSIVTGPPGSGKTALIALANFIARWLYRDLETPICGVALAGRAASVLAESATVARTVGGIDATLKFPAMTIHRAFGLSPDADELDEPEPTKSIECGVLVVDETSMINAPLLATIFARSTAHHIVLVGDAYQLEPIGPGAPMTDLLRGNWEIPVTRLKRNYRTEVESLCSIVSAIRDGDFDEYGLMWSFGGDGVQYISADFSSLGVIVGNLIGDLEREGVDPHEIAVITPRNVGDDGTDALNRDIRLTLGFGPAPQIGDLLIVTKNNYRAFGAGGGEEAGRVAIFNGERCEIIRVEGDFLDVSFPGSRTAVERRVRLLANGDHPPEGTKYGRAMTAHKAQGSQFEIVILVTTRPGRFVSKAGVYTGASRARERLFIVGDESDLADVARQAKLTRRTLLCLIGDKSEFVKSGRNTTFRQAQQVGEVEF
jgi:exodeoxyribonuclease V alpha subunit